MLTNLFFINSTRAKIVLVPLIITVVIITVLIALNLSWEEKEPLTPGQILEKQQWTKQELIETMSRMSLQRHRKNRGLPKEVYRHIRRQMKKLPVKERHEVTTQVIVNSIEKGRDLWRNMEPKARKNLLKKMKTEATKNRIASQNMTKEEKEELKMHMSKPETKKIFDKIQRTSISKLTPEERRDLAPIVKEWIKTVENL